MKTLHFDCFAGISGDMTLGALVDLGVDPEALRQELGKLGVEGWKLDFVRDERCGITGTRALVQVEEGEHEHHHHEHEEGHDHHHAHHHWSQIKDLIEKSGLSGGAKERGVAIFTRVAEAEAAVHGVSVDDVAFHEVGALDSIIDVCGAAICLDMLAPERVTASAIELGGGTVTCAHGILPVPAPATAKILTGLPVKVNGFDKEMTTPTGAAILAASVDEFITGPASFTELKVGVGIGGRKLDKPNVLRVSWRDADASNAGASNAKEASWDTEKRILLEANVDDMTGEEMGFFMERMFANGALDVTFTPCQMKKSRPGTIIAVLTNLEKAQALREAFFKYSQTIGFRETPVTCRCLRREEKDGVKTVFLGGKKLRSKVEFEKRAAEAREKGRPLNG
jgi:uncharacterized protein (TIGR00299 family) protein